MNQQPTISIAQLKLLPFSQLPNLRPYLSLIKTQFMPTDPYNLYLHLLKHPILTEQQTHAIISHKQPLEILQLIFNQHLLNVHLNCMNSSMLPNTFAVLKLIKEKVQVDVLQKVMKTYFQYKEKQDEGQQKVILTKQIVAKEILGVIKYWHDKKFITVNHLLTAFQQIHATTPQSQLQNQLKLIELIISLQNYTTLGFLPHSPKLKNSIIKGFMLFHSGVCNFITPSLYLQLIKPHNDQCKQVQIFIDLYTTLNSFGVHLIKDLWSQFTLLCNSQTQLNYIPLDTLMSILLQKVTQHSNDNIPKNCIRDLLKSDTIDFSTLFTAHQTVVYDSLIPILNSGQFYIDCALQKDSKFSKYVYTFFSRAYNLMSPENLQQHLKIFIESVSKWITYDQALPAFLMVFNHIEKEVGFFGKDEIEIVVRLVEKVYKNVHMRKRWQIVGGILECLRRFRGDGIEFEDLVKVVGVIPDEAYRWKFIHDDDEGEDQKKRYSHRFNLKSKLRDIIQTIPTNQLTAEFTKLSQQSFTTLSQILPLYRLLRIHNWIPFPSLANKIKQLSLSSYSTQHQNEIIILHMYYQLLEINSLEFNWKISQSLNLVKTYIVSYYHNEYEKEIVRIVESLTKLVLGSSNENNRQELAKFVEWIIYSIAHYQEEKQEYLYLLYEILLKIISLEYSIPQQELQIEQALYQLPKTLYSLKTPKQNRYPSIKLRIQLFLSLLFTKDKSYPNKTRQQFLTDPLSLIDRYDYEHYHQIFFFYKHQYLPHALKHSKYDQLSQLQSTILSSLLSNLEYSIRKQDISSYFSFILDDRILSDKQLWSSGVIPQWITKLIKIGNNYVYFHRILANTLYGFLTRCYEDIVREGMLVGYVDVVYQLLELEEYRGFDAEVSFYEQQKELDVIEFRRSLPEKAEYYGMYIRFLFMKWISDILTRSNTPSPNQQQFFLKLSHKIFTFSIEDQTANRMMFSPSFRSKLRLWQSMQILIPFFTTNVNSAKYLSNLIPVFLKQLQQPNQPQIKHYIELFITRVILHHPFEFIPIFVQKLRSETSLSQSITNVIISGLILKKEFNEELYNSVLSLICHNTAYLRGLTQYFCFYNFKEFQGKIDKTSLIRKLYDQFATNPDSIRLADRVRTLITTYLQKLHTTNLAHFCSLEIYKAGEIIEEYIQDGLKRIGLQIVKQIKDNDEGFILMKDLWKRQAEYFLPKPSPHIEQPKGFQKKIDPVIEQLSATQKPPSLTKLKILASSLESIYNYGHLVRTGEIFSVEELAIKSIDILSDDSFKSVSCTGEKWLNVREVKSEESLAYVMECIREGYVPVVITEGEEIQGLGEFNMPEKVLLILPNQRKRFYGFMEDLEVQKVFVGTGLAVHVEAAIFIWEYVKKNVIEKGL